MKLNRKALVVEDDNLYATLVKKMLTQNSYDVVATFAKGEEAIDYLKENSVSMITMDIDLEGELNGIETTEQLRAFTETPVLFLSARRSEEVEEQTKVFQPSLFLNKFINNQRFTEAIATLQEQK